MKNGWTGGQYSFFRVLLGIYLAVHFAQLAPWAEEIFSRQGALADRSASPLLTSFVFPNVFLLADGPQFATALVALGVPLAFLFAVGFHARASAIAIWYLLACLFGRNPLIANPSLPYVGWILIAHACLPGKPYGSWQARGRTDPDGNWRFPPAIFACAWIAMAVGYSYSGVSKLVSPSWVDGSALERVLENPLARDTALRTVMLSLPAGFWKVATWATLGLELLFAPLALLPRVRPWLWSVMVAMHVGLLFVIDFADLSLGMLLLHAFTFDPAWVPPKRAPLPDRMFYDGLCGLCHRAVRFVLAEDRTGTSVRFAPLQGDTFATLIPAEQRAGLPDSAVVLTGDGELCVRSDAMIRLGERLGGVWRVLAVTLRAIPRPLRDLAYDAVARVRRQIFGRTNQACPLSPRELTVRFDA
jgi:predicted DCC family thiol-disulfide oxidoreductase YuxK